MTAIPQAQIHGVNDLRLDTVAAPECGDGDVVVAVAQCGICGTDLSYLAMGGLTGPETPMPIGHELWGTVHAAGQSVTHVAVGDRVVVQPMSNGRSIGNGGTEGGFTPYLLVRDAARFPGSVIALPSDIPDEFGALVEPLAVAQHSANRVHACAEDRAVIFGAGPIGLSILQLLVYRGLSDIAVVDLSERRLGVAKELGARVIRGDDALLSTALTDLHGSKDFFGMGMPASTLFFEATGVRAVLESVLELAGPGSRICLTGVHKEAVTIDPMLLLAKELSIIASMGYENEFDEVIAILRSGRIDPRPMVTHQFSLSSLDAAFSTAADTEQAIKIMINCQG